MASVYRAGVWFLHGWWNYGKSGYDRASKNFDARDLEVNLSDQIAVITGTENDNKLDTNYYEYIPFLQVLIVD